MMAFSIVRDRNTLGLAGCASVALGILLFGAPSTSLASISVGDYNGGGPSTVSSFGSGDTLGGLSTVNSGHHTFNGTTTNLVGATLTLSHGSSLTQWDGTGGGGELVNRGTWNYSGTARGGFSIRGGTMTIRNQGVFESTAPTIGGNSGNFYFSNSSGAGLKRWINEAGSIFRHSTNTTFLHEVAASDIQFHQYGTLVATNSGTIRWGSSGGIHSGSGGTWDSTDGTIQIAGTVSNLQGTAVGNPVGMSGTLGANAANSYLNFAGEGFQWTSGRRLSHGGNVFELDGTVEAVASGGTQVTGSPGGYLRFTGHFIANYTGGDLTCDMQANSQIRNAGIYEIIATGSNREIYGRASSVTFYNEATGVMTQNVSGTFLFSGGAGTFRNAGTIVMNAGAMQFANWSISPNTVSSGDLLEGTYIANGGNINLPGGSYDTISTNAKVVLGATGNFYDITTASFTTLYGSFGLHEGRTWTTGGALATDANSRLEFGLDNTASDAKLTLGASSTLQAKIDVVDIGDTLSAGNSFTVVDMTAGQTLTDGGISLGTFTSGQDLAAVVAVTPGLNGTVVVNITGTAVGTVIILR